MTISYHGNLELSTGLEGRVRPVSVTCQHNGGDILVTESRRSSIHVFNDKGIETFVTNRFAGLSLPRDAATDDRGRLVCLTKAGGWLNVISRLDIYGEPDAYEFEAVSGNWNPEHLLVLRDGNYLTLDGDSGLLVKHHQETGDILWTARVGDEEMSDVHLGRPFELPSGVILVPGGRLHRIFVLTETGDVVDSFGRYGSAPGRMVFPVSIASGPGETILVLDRLRHKILAFDDSYRFLSEFGSLGSRPGQFYHPVSMAADSEGLLYVAQGYQGRVQVFNVAGDRDN